MDGLIALVFLNLTKFKKRATMLMMLTLGLLEIEEVRRVVRERKSSWGSFLDAIASPSTYPGHWVSQ